MCKIIVVAITMLYPPHYNETVFSGNLIWFEKLEMVVRASQSLSHAWFFVIHGLSPTRILCSWGYPEKNTGMGFHSLLLGFFSTQGSNPGLLYCRWILYWLRHQGLSVVGHHWNNFFFLFLISMIIWFEKLNLVEDFIKDFLIFMFTNTNIIFV